MYLAPVSYVVAMIAALMDFKFHVTDKSRNYFITTVVSSYITFLFVYIYISIASAVTIQLCMSCNIMSDKLLFFAGLHFWFCISCYRWNESSSQHLDF